LENKIIAHESQGNFRQDELIGGKLPVVKWLTLNIQSQSEREEEEVRCSTQSAYMERLIPPSQDETPLPSSDSWRHSQEGDGISLLRKVG
jgi:hypothetical protein